MPRASVLLAAQHKVNVADEDANESEDEDERRDDGMMGSCGIMNSGVGKNIGDTGELFRTGGGTLRRRETGEAVITSLPHQTSSAPSFESRRAQAPRGNRDSIETSFTQLLSEEHGEESGGSVGRCHLVIFFVLFLVLQENHVPPQIADT
jgi:hypothetical protein